jgi:putative oxidoreductase
MENKQARWGVTILRIASASVFVLHGLARVSLGTVGGFGTFLESWGLPAGTAIAWTLTLMELIGGLALALGVAVRPLAAWFACEMLAGIVMVHAKHGWFVVGAGQGGAEYSALILACLAAAALTDALGYRIPLAATEAR